MTTDPLVAVLVPDIRTSPLILREIKRKEQVQKSAIRVCGDWSEHISSSGKRYYYNCKTEVSQWEKPKDWNSEMCKTPDHRSKDGRQRLQSSTPHANK
ncbi:WW domain-containing adapter protein with coiled-coil, partial [Elysia marginata]